MNQQDDLEAPNIPIRNDRKEIDLELLGEDHLETIIKYTGMEINDVVRTQWWGANPKGKPFDDGATYSVAAGDLVTGLRVQVSNAIVTGAQGGEAFYSYRVTKNQVETQSLRSFSFVGVRAAEVLEELPVVLAIESHQLHIKPDELDAEGVTFVIAPYQALKINDTIAFSFTGFDEDGVGDEPIVETLTVTKEHLDGKALTFTVGKNIFRLIDPGRAEVSYQINFIDGKVANSPVQKFLIDSDALLPDLLPEPIIVDHVPGEPVSPGKFRNGLTIRVPGYPGMTISDRVTLCWRSPIRDLLQTIRVDTSTQTVGEVAFHVPVDYLLENQGLRVSLYYLFGREGAGERSLELPVNIETMRELSAPLVSAAIPDEPKDSGTLPALDALGGVWVQVPDVLLPGERAEVEWRGWPGYGEYTAKTPDASNPLRFHIPAQYVPANMGRGAVDETRRFEVVYRVFGEGEPSESAPYHLRIKPITANKYPQVGCKQVASGKLSLANVPDDGADLELGSWYYGRAGDLIELSISGVTSLGEMNKPIRDATQPVTESEAEHGVKAKLDKAILEELLLDRPFTLHVRLSFDGGALYMTLPPLSPVLIY